jgi:hypothetical protein
MGAGIAVSGLFIVATIINLFASGIPNPVADTRAWESEQPWPLIPVPSWVVVSVGVIPLVVTFSTWRLVDRRHRGLLWNTLLYTATIFGLLPILLAAAYPEPGGVPNGDSTFGWHWLAVPLQVVVTVLLIIRIATVSPSRVPDFEHRAEADELRRAKYDRKLRAELERRRAAADVGPAGIETSAAGSHDLGGDR